uniref:protein STRICTOSIDINE SYNTHASE-LIKE 11-like n=1 Tax=Erigeron canadensis TaxID=72917 RepID=UPI001CB94ABD|nr:protein STRICTOSIDINE SYNTHASE-LIKE 11-like [Erigeron canadensis]
MANDHPKMVASFSYPFVAFVFVLCMSITNGQYANFNKLELPQGVSGPESAAFRGVLVFSEGPFTTVTDGRILKWQGPNVGFVDFAYTSPQRTKQFCDGNTDSEKGPICGRPLALSFHPVTGLLYIADAFFGLLVVGPQGGLATQLVGGFKFLTGLDIDLLRGDIYLSDSSLVYDIRNATQPGFTPDSTGRFLRYNPHNRQVTTLLSGLFGGGGPAVSKDGTFVLVAELLRKRISKYWLVGSKANTAEVLLDLDGNPNKIKRAERKGEFWVAVSVGNQPRAPLVVPRGIRINSDGVVLQTVSFATQFFNKSISIVQERDGKLYVGSRNTTSIGVYSN